MNDRSSVLALYHRRTFQESHKNYESLYFLHVFPSINIQALRTFPTYIEAEVANGEAVLQGVLVPERPRRQVGPLFAVRPPMAVVERLGETAVEDERESQNQSQELKEL